MPWSALETQNLLFSSSTQMIFFDIENKELHGARGRSQSNTFVSPCSAAELFLEDNLLMGSWVGVRLLPLWLLFGHWQACWYHPSELSSLTELQAIGLDENLLTGTIPEVIYSSFTNLMILYLDANHLEGTISNNVQKLRKLVDLRLRQNTFAGSLPTTLRHYLTRLELLYVKDNKLTGTIPPCWDLMQRLQELKLYKNVLMGTLPDQIHMVNTLSKWREEFELLVIDVWKGTWQNDE